MEDELDCYLVLLLFHDVHGLSSGTDLILVNVWGMLCSEIVGIVEEERDSCPRLHWPRGREAD